MRVALLYPHWANFPPRKAEYAMEVVGMEMATRLAQRGVDVTTYSRGTRWGWDTVVDAGVLHRRTPQLASTVSRHPATCAASLARSRTLALGHAAYTVRAASDIRRTRCDIAHIHICDELIPTIRSISPRTRIVLHMHDHKQGHYSVDVEAPLSQADVIVGCSAFIAERARRAFPGLSDRVCTVTNAVDVELFERMAFSEVQGSGKRLLFVGRLSPEKGVHTLLEAFETVLSRHPDAQLQLVGPMTVPPLSGVDPGDEYRLLDEFRDFYLEPARYGQHLRDLLSPAARAKVHFVESVSHAETVRYFHEADLLVFPSIWEEPFGLPVIEAMASRLPVVATNSGAFPEVIEQGVTGLLVAPGDAPGLAAAITSLLDDPSRRRAMGIAGIQRARERFSWTTRVDEWIEVYERVLSPTTRTPPAAGTLTSITR